MLPAGRGDRNGNPGGLLEILKTDYPHVHCTIEDISTMSERATYFGNRTDLSIRGFMGY